MPKGTSKSRPALKKAPAKSSTKGKAPVRRKATSDVVGRKEDEKSKKSEDKAKKAAQKAKRAEEDERIRQNAKNMISQENDDGDASSGDDTQLGKRKGSTFDSDGDFPTMDDEKGSEDGNGEGTSLEKRRSLSGGPSENESGSDEEALATEVDSDDEPGGAEGNRTLADETNDCNLVVEEENSRPSKRPRLSTSKVTREQLSPKSLRLAEAGRTGIRVLIATDEEHGGFPLDHIDLTWDLLVKLAEKESADEDWMEILDSALKDITKKRKMTGYSWIGASQMRGELKKKVIAILRAHFGIPAASKAETRDLVTWLLEKGHFKYGGLDTKNRTFDPTQPLGHPIVRDLIYQQWFSSGRAEGISQRTASAFKDIPLPIIVLVLTVVENALLEYKQEGVRSEIKFSLECMGPRYAHHMKCAKALRDKSPNWMTSFRKSLFKSIVEQTKYVHLLADTDNGEVDEELDGLDFDALEKSAEQD